MLELQGKYTKAKVFTNNIESEAISQIIELCNQEAFKDAQIRIMPDTHAGKGCVIGTTIPIKDKVIPNLVGVDIGCGMLCVNLGNVELDLQKIDTYIRNNIPHGHKINEQPQTDFKAVIENLICFRDIPKSAREYNRALGTLGGGNHFIEINTDGDNKYLVIHSGSRNLGLQVANYYQNKAFDYHNGLSDAYEEARIEMIAQYKAEGKREEIQQALAKLKEQYKNESKIPKDLCYLEGQLMANYLHDMNIAQSYALINRVVMARRIVEECLGLKFHELESFQTIHNYIDTITNILRKGAISAKAGEKVLIPINMRDGSLICVGKGNPDWNYSAPHGAGRLMSRSKAKEVVDLEEFKESMKDVWTSCVGQSTLDESPMVYKPMQEILDNITDTVEVLKIIKPIYNFKSN